MQQIAAYVWYIVVDFTKQGVSQNVPPHTN
jgi:hypothetical protein